MLVHWDKVDWARLDQDPLQGQRLGAAAGAARAGLSRYRMSAGERAMPVHVHADEEEIFYVLGGRGASWQDGRSYAVEAGDCIVHCAGAEAHTIVADDGGLTLLAWGTREPNDVAWYPDSKEANLRGIGIRARLEPLEG